MSKENHSFSVSAALEIGIESAILLGHFCFIQKTNVGNDENWQEKWTRRTAGALKKTYPYWSLRQIRRFLDHMEAGEYLFYKIENEKKSDRGKSYLVAPKGLALLGYEALQNSGMEVGKEKETMLPNGDMDVAKREHQMLPNGDMDVTKREHDIKVDNTSLVSNLLGSSSAGANAPLSSPFKKTGEILDLEAEKEKIFQTGAGGEPKNGQAATRLTIHDPETPGAVIYDHIPHKGYPTHEPAGEYKRVNIPEEIDRMRNDPAALEGFVIGRKLPREKFAEYLQAFEVEQVGLETKYKNIRELRLHFQNWSCIRFGIAQRKATQSTRSKIVPLGGDSSRYGEKQKF